MKKNNNKTMKFRVVAFTFLIVIFLAIFLKMGWDLGIIKSGNKLFLLIAVGIAFIGIITLFSFLTGIIKKKN